MSASINLDPRIPSGPLAEKWDRHEMDSGLVAPANRRKFHVIKGEIPSPIDPPAGCHFHPRCPHAFARCSAERPRLREVAPGQWAACHLHDRNG
mgnify:CR=1 FL=1